MSDAPVTLLGGGAVGPGVLAEALARAPVLVAADGGADAALAAGRTPAAVIGDFDSISRHARRRLSPEILYEVLEQDSTDFDKALRLIDVPLSLAVGFTGARLDHELAVFHTLAARPERRCIVIGDRDVVFLAPPRIALDLAPGTRVSLFPMAEVSGRSEGLRWKIDGLAFHPARRIGTSNAALHGPVRLEAHGPGLLVILPRDALDAVIAGLAAAGTERWGV
ncbi:MAG: thiamine diphosphokinase [Roseicyclus sp.]